MEQQPTWRVEVSSAVGHTSHTPTSSFTSCPRRSSTTDELPPRSRRIRCVWLVFRRRWLWFVINTQVVWLWLQQVVCVAAFRMYGYGSISSHREMHVRACCACVLAVYSTMCYWCMYSHLCALKLKMRPSHSTQDTRTFTWWKSLYIRSWRALVKLGLHWSATKGITHFKVQFVYGKNKVSHYMFFIVWIVNMEMSHEQNYSSGCLCSKSLCRCTWLLYFHHSHHLAENNTESDFWGFPGIHLFFLSSCS